MPFALYESPHLRRVTGPALRPGGLAVTERALELCRFPAGARVLDVGCGLGATAGHLTREHGLAALGLDLSPILLEQNRERHPKLPLLRARADAIPLGDASLAGVFCECVLSLMPDPAGVLAECRRVLEPEGWLVLADIYLRRPAEAPEMRALPFGGCLRGARGREAMEEMVNAAGFTITLWEDHSDHLKRLAAELVFAHGSLAAFWGCSGAGDKAAGVQTSLARAKPGYFLMPAQKKA